MIANVTNERQFCRDIYNMLPALVEKK